MTAYRIAVAAGLSLCLGAHAVLGQPASASAADAPPAAADASPSRGQPSSPVVAPRSDKTSFLLSLALPIAAPTGGFGANVDGAAGISGSFDIVLGRSMVSVGGEGSYLIYGQTNYEADLRAVAPELGDATASVVTDNAVVLVHGRVRVQPRQGRWRPYLDGLAGFRRIYTSTALEGCNNSYACASNTNASDYGPSVGVGAGFQLRLGASPTTVKLLDVSVRYFAGGEASYLKEGAIRHLDGRAVYDVSRSRTDMVVVYIGFSFGVGAHSIL